MESLKGTEHPLHNKFPPEWEQQFQKAGATLDFVPWHGYVYRLEELVEDGHIRSWSSMVDDVTLAGNNILMVVSVSIRRNDGSVVTHHGTGDAKATKDKWGGAHPEAYSQAFRRACAHHGLGLYFYEGEDDVRSDSRRLDGDGVRSPSGHASGDVVRDDRSGDRHVASPPTKKQRQRLGQLAESGVFSDQEADRWREQLADNWTKSGAGVILRQMKDEYKERTGEDFTPPEDEMS